MTVYTLFRNQVLQNPDLVAVSYNQTKLSYKELEIKANQMSAFLSDKGVKKGDIVGLCVNRSEKMIIALLGIIKCGAAYLPLDPSFPDKRLEYMLYDSHTPYLLSENSLLQKFPYYQGNKLDINEVEGFNSSEDLIYNSDENGLAYLIYTSGSTGNPKGVKITQQSLVNFLLSMQKTPGINKNDSVLALTTLSFDIAGLEIFLPLISGAEVRVISKDIARDGKLLLAEMQNATLMQATPATWKLLVESGWNTKFKLKALCGGEPFGRDLADKILERVDELWNMYGPTETTIWSSCARIERGTDTIHLGKPIANTQFYIVDQNNNFCPPGVAGELLIGGLGLSSGYLNREELTKEKFVANPFDKSGNSLVYRTGDLVKLNAKMQIEFIGRIDNQVKIRGYRIELGEIEAEIRKNENIKDAVVVLKQFDNGDKKLVAFYIPKNGVENKNNIIEHTLESWKERWEFLYQSVINSTDKNKILSVELDHEVEKKLTRKKKLVNEAYYEWLNQSIERIISLNPKDVLEIGVGGGELLKAIAPQCNSYSGIDISASSIHLLNNQVTNQLDAHKNKINLFVQDANSQLPFEKQSFDTIVLNSVIQYFPNKEYLLDVINKSIGLIKDDGCIYIGDVQSYTLLRNYHLNDQLNHINDNIRVLEFKNIVNRRVQNEEELVIDPDFFYSLKSIDKRISKVEIKLRKGSINNETTLYHYDVLIFINRKLTKFQNIILKKWESDLNSIAEIRELLSTVNPEVLMISDIPNKRLFENLLNESIIDSSNDTDFVKQVLMNKDKSSDFILPDDFLQLEKDNKYKVELMIAPNSSQIKFDAIFYGHGLQSCNVDITSIYEIKGNDLEKYCNNPINVFASENIITELKNSLNNVFPDYMVPSFFISIDKFPLTPSGKIDRKALEKYEIKVSDNKKRTLPPENDTQKLLLDIWKKHLGLDEISIKDNFFEIGGHSILAAQVFTDVENILGVKVPLATLFKYQTIKELSQIIDDTNWKSDWSPIVLIKKGSGKTNLFLVHGAEGNILLYRDLAKHLDSKYNIYGLQSKGLSGSGIIPNSIEEMATDYTEAILSIQSEGLFNIGGYCMGGTIAYEIAQQLTKKGFKVNNLFLIETYNVCVNEQLSSSKSNGDKIENIKFHFDNIKRLKGADKVRFISQKAEVLKRRTIAKINLVSDKIGISVKDNPGTSKSTFKIRDINDEAQTKYIPQTYNGKTVLLKPKVSYSSEPDPKFGWDKYIKNKLIVYNLNLAPRGMLVEPFVNETASIIQKELEA